MLQVTNDEFIRAIFGQYAPTCHVTQFDYDPANIPPGKHLIAWKGDYYSRSVLTPGFNQYFTISTFHADEQGTARRRKALFMQTHCIVLDDVKEKLDASVAARLPAPSWILETSPGSEQWGYILRQPETVASRVDNLNDGLIASDLAPSGKDPGQRGVTRYVRLPEGSNTKASKMINGTPFKCRMLKWSPFSEVTLEQLAEPFNINLDASRRESRIDGAADVNDHPLIHIPDVIHIKEERSAGRFDITCPWVNDHTGQDDSGTAVFTNADGTLGFKCHHGGCEGRTGRHLLEYIDGEMPQFRSTLKQWQVIRGMTAAGPPPPPGVVTAPPGGAVTAPPPPPPVAAQQPGEPAAAEGVVMPQALEDLFEDLISKLRRETPGTQVQRDLSASILKTMEDIPVMDQDHWHKQVADVMNWSKTDMTRIIKGLRSTWYQDKKASADFYTDNVYVHDLDQFYSFSKRMFRSTTAFQNAFVCEDESARENALKGACKKVDKMDYAPNQSEIFEEDGLVIGNMWSDITQHQGEQGDISRWLDHWVKLGWGAASEHAIKWLAYTLRHPENKINHMLILGGLEGSGKDFLLYPIMKAMGENGHTISGEQLVEGFNGYLKSTKYLRIDEIEFGNRREADMIAVKLKPLASAPPMTLSVNEKGLKRINVRNIVNVVMTTNSQTPIRLEGTSRRFFPLWSDLNVRDEHGNTTPAWKAYWNDRWGWMIDNEGWKAVVWYLMNVVDLSDFNPGEAPQVTEFLREISAASETPLQASIRGYVRRRYGRLAADLVNRRDIAETMSLEVFRPPELEVDPSRIGDRAVQNAMNGIDTFRKVKTQEGDIWILRNKEKYRGWTPKQISDERVQQQRAWDDGKLLGLDEVNFY